MTAARSRAARSSSCPAPAINDWRSPIWSGSKRRVYYAATDLEARICTGSEVIVIGGGTPRVRPRPPAQQGSGVSIAIRGSDLAKSMSAYLIERIAADPRIQVLTNTEVRTGRCRALNATVEFTPTGERRTLPCIGLFCFIGADPRPSGSREWWRWTPAVSS
jgi:thioredoxin reductase